MACRCAGRTKRELRPAGMIVVAYGKFGGIELGYGSDLDLVFLHDSAGDVQRTAGPAVVDNSVFFLRARAAPGPPADDALGRGPACTKSIRACDPAARAGCSCRASMASPITSAAEAWTWEHQALLRSRAVAGGGELAPALRDAARRVAAHGRAARVAARRRALDARAHARGVVEVEGRRVRPQAGRGRHHRRRVPGAVLGAALVRTGTPNS